MEFEKHALGHFEMVPEYRGGHISGVLIRGVPLYRITELLNFVVLAFEKSK